jgi:hypothetical protein
LFVDAKVCHNCPDYWYAEGVECKGSCPKYINEKNQISNTVSSRVTGHENDIGIERTFYQKLDKLQAKCISTYIKEYKQSNALMLEGITYTFNFLKQQEDNECR